MSNKPEWIPLQSQPSDLDILPAKPLRIALVNMPWARTNTPSIQCGLLQAILSEAGHHVRSIYPNLALSRALGANRYDMISNIHSERLHLFGEWLFAPAVFDVSDDDAYRREFPDLESTLEAQGIGWEAVRDLRHRTLVRWLDDLAEDKIWSELDLVGFTSTFLQNVASLALAKRLKERYPALVTVFGGANYDGTMGPEYLRRLPHIDYVVVGEGDLALPRLAAALSAGRPPADIPGVCSRIGEGEVVLTPPALPFNRMDDLPTPNYDDYFATLAELGEADTLGRKKVRLLVEFSRGCWWGQKHHCTFCGLNALGMQFRSKSTKFAFRDIEQLMRRHKVHRIDAVDNIIDQSIIKSLSSAIRESRWDIELFFEIKANLNREQMRLLADAGVRRVQPGIESLSTHILRLMRKGSSLLLNVRLLKWARYYDIHVAWNILSGFPGESDRDYTSQAELLPSLHHLQPPSSMLRIWLERFSPYFEDPALGLGDMTPRSAYRHVYEVPGIDHAAIAYFFDYSARNVASATATRELSQAVERWQQAWAQSRRPSLTYRRGPDWIELHDNRSCSARVTDLDGWRSHAYELCGDAPRTAPGVGERLAKIGYRVPVAEVSSFLDQMTHDGLMLREGNQHLSLALPIGQPMVEATVDNAAPTG